MLYWRVLIKLNLHIKFASKREKSFTGEIRVNNKVCFYHKGVRGHKLGFEAAVKSIHKSHRKDRISQGILFVEYKGLLCMKRAGLLKQRIDKGF